MEICCKELLQWDVNARRLRLRRQDIIVCPMQCFGVYLVLSLFCWIDRHKTGRPIFFLRRNMVNGFRPPVTLSDDLV